MLGLIKSRESRSLVFGLKPFKAIIVRLTLFSSHMPSLQATHLQLFALDAGLHVKNHQLFWQFVSLHLKLLTALTCCRLLWITGNQVGTNSPTPHLDTHLAIPAFWASHSTSVLTHSNSNQSFQWLLVRDSLAACSHLTIVIPVFSNKLLKILFPLHVVSALGSTT